MDFNMSFMGGAKREVKRSPGVSAPVDTQRSTETETTNFFDPTKNHSSATGAYASATYEERRYALVSSDVWILDYQGTVSRLNSIAYTFCTNLIHFCIIRDSDSVRFIRFSTVV